MVQSFIFSNHPITVSEPLTAELLSYTDFVIKLAPIEVMGSCVPQPVGKLVYDAKDDIFSLEDLTQNVCMGIVFDRNGRTYTVHITLVDCKRRANVHW